MASSGNFCNFSIPLRPRSPYSSSDQITGGGLSIKLPSSGGIEPVIASMSPNSGKWYWEYRAGQGGTNTSGRPSIAVSEQGVKKDSEYYGGKSGITGVLFVTNDGGKRINGSDTSYGNTVSQHDIVQIALDCDNGAVYFGINNTWQNSGNPESGASKTGAALNSGIQNVAIDILHVRYVGGTIDQYNFGQDDTFGGAITGAGNTDGNGHGVFKYAPPSGYLALCSANLPIDDNVDPAQTDDDYIGGKQHNTIVYTGNASTNAITGLGFKPDLVWIQNYSSQNQTARIQDSSRGVTKSLEPAYTTNEGTESGVTSFDSDGFTLGSQQGGYNSSGASYVSWCWRANGGTTATNSDGDVDSTVQANPDAGFSIVQFPNYSGDTKFGHGLTKAPNFIIAKLISGGSNWPTYHDGYDSGKTCFLNTNAAQFSSSHFAHSGTGNPVSATTFGMGASFAGSGAGIAYCWHDVDGFQKFGSYEGNGSSDGPFIYLGFRPKLVVIRAIDSNQMWAVCDTARETFNPMGEKVLQWNADGAEFDPSGFNFDTVSNGIKIRNSDTNINSSGATFIYMAWGDVPFKYNNTF